MASPSSAASAHNAKVIILPLLLLHSNGHQRTLLLLLLLLLHRLRLTRHNVAAACSPPMRAVHSKLPRPIIESAATTHVTIFAQNNAMNEKVCVCTWSGLTGRPMVCSWAAPAIRAKMLERGEVGQFMLRV